MPKTPAVEGKSDGGTKAARRLRMKVKAEEALKGSDLEGLLEMVGANQKASPSAEALLKGLLAEKAVEYVLDADRVKKEKGLRRLGAAALIIAAGRQ